MSRRIHAGIDTGGTYTDAALIDPVDRRVITSAKSLTTKGNLAVGVGKALARALADAKGEIDASDIAVVSVSTTLATNAVVEGHGSRVGVILAGFDDAMTTRTGIAKAFPDVPIIRVAGGHDHNGEEVATLDIDLARSGVEVVAGNVSAFAIASAFAVRNAAHELALRDVVQRVTAKPTTLSSELTSDLDAPRRALTATLNARLIARITTLVSSVKSAMADLKIVCPLMIVKGDGSLARAEDVALRPIETVLSGPAASVIGAKWLSRLDDFILSDIGGTTTDVAVLERGMPRVAHAGARVGGWRTMVRAIDVTTTGLGGDSETHVAVDGTLTLGPQRVVPLSLLANRFPNVLDVLEGECSESAGGSQFGRFVLLPFETSIKPDHGLGAREQEIYDAVKAEPIAVRKIAATSLSQRVLAGLVKKGLIQVSSFAPSDAAHVLGLQNNWSREGALLGARLAVFNRDRKAPTDQAIEEFCRDVWSELAMRSARCVLDAALPPGMADEKVVRAVCEGHPVQGLVAFSATPLVPLIAVGGPARVFYPEVGRRLQCDVVFVEQADVANAVGAAAGLAQHRADVRVEGDGAGVFRVFDGVSTLVFQSGIAALVEAEALARRRVRALALSFGAVADHIDVVISKNHLPDATSDEGLLNAFIVAKAVTSPLGAATATVAL